MRWTVLLLGLCIVLAGCSGSNPTSSTQSATTLPPDETPIDTTAEPSATTSSQPGTTVTATSIPAPSPTATPTPTSKATRATETTPTATAQEAQEETRAVYAGTGEWAEVTVDGETDMRVRINNFTIRDEVETDDGTLDAPEGEQWVVVNTTIRTLPGDDIRLGYTQWRLLTVGPQIPQPDDAAMRRADYENMLPDETTHEKNDAEQYRIIFATDYTREMTFVMYPFGSQNHRPLVFSR